MFQAVKFAVSSLLLAVAVNAAAQSGYQVVSLGSSGAIVGRVKWSGPLPHLAAYPITKDPAICDPESHKTRDLERLTVGPQGGVANTVVFLKNISRGKAMEMPAATFSGSEALPLRAAHSFGTAGRTAKNEEF
jgi:hypothetical protein